MTALEELWWRRDEPRSAELLLWPLTLASLGYRAGAAIARGRARPARAAAPTISIGNLCVGGAGKTPVALAIAERLLSRGRRPAVLSRGYGGSARAQVTQVLAQTDAALCGDEPALLARRLPGLLILVGKRRSLLADEAVRRGADVLLLDDGLQHHALARDLDVLVVDASNPLGNGRLLPRGPLREGTGALERLRGGRGLLWLTRANLQAQGDQELRRLIALATEATGRPPVQSEFVPAAGAPDLRGRRVFLFAAIARPASFEALARKLGAQITGARWFRDHHRFTPAELDELRRAAGDSLLLTTEKDLMRAPGVQALPVDQRLLEGAESLEAALDAVLAR